MGNGTETNLDRRGALRDMSETPEDLALDARGNELDTGGHELGIEEKSTTLENMSRKV